MADSAIIIRWGGAIPGREEIGIGTFQKAVAHFTQVVGKGELEALRLYVNDNGNFSAEGGSMVLEGSEAQIVALEADTEYRAMVMRGISVAENFTTARAATGAAVMQRIEQVVGIRKELGLIK